MRVELQAIQAEALDALKAVKTPDALESLRITYFGRRGKLTDVMKGMGKLSKAERPVIGKLANEVRATLTEAFEAATQTLYRQQQEQQLEAEAVDITLPGRKPTYGKAHPIMQTLERIETIFRQMGFQVVTGPDIETEYYNFDALNTPADHPARDLHDTFYLTDGHLLRTHTSPVQDPRHGEPETTESELSCRGSVIGWTMMSQHTPMFHQVEGLLVDSRATFSELKGVLTSFARQMFGDTRRRCVSVPTSSLSRKPSAEMDISCAVCQGKGCRSCGGHRMGRDYGSRCC